MILETIHLVDSSDVFFQPIVSVLVLEYGVIDTGERTKIPYMGTKLNTNDMFKLFSAPEPFLHNTSFSVSAGSVAGGGTTVNGKSI